MEAHRQQTGVLPYAFYTFATDGTMPDWPGDPYGVQYSISAELMQFIEGDEQYDAFYVFSVYTDKGDHIATAGWFAVGVFTGAIWGMDIAGGDCRRE